jgi:hypothetical protein
MALSGSSLFNSAKKHVKIYTKIVSLDYTPKKPLFLSLSYTYKLLSCGMALEKELVSYGYKPEVVF